MTTEEKNLLKEIEQMNLIINLDREHDELCEKIRKAMERLEKWNAEKQAHSLLKMQLMAMLAYHEALKVRLHHYIEAHEREQYSWGVCTDEEEADE